jgi:hypothetical protein
MTGGLLQLVTSGRQDIYLTIDPEITFFKKVYRRYTNFSFELKEIIPEQIPQFNNDVSFIMNTYGDALHRCYIEITLPNLHFSDNLINSTIGAPYFEKKKTDINNLNIQLKKWIELYRNLKGYCDVEIVLYRKLLLILQTENISMNLLNNIVTNFNYVNKATKDDYKNKIAIIDKIDISSYITSINNKLITNDPTKTSSSYILRTTIISEITNRYNNMVIYLDFYHRRINYYTVLINNKSDNYQINFNYSEYLGHNYFEYFTLQISGIEYVKYYNDFLHINQMHKIKEDYMPNYLKMIGQTPILNTFDTTQKGGNKIIIPLIFWFCKDAGASLPLIALKYPTITINAKIQNIKKIICFENYDKMFNDIIKVMVLYDEQIIINTNLKYFNYTIDLKLRSVNYNCKLINDELLKIQFPDLTNDERVLILSNGTNNEINRNQWIYFMTTIKDPKYSSLASKVGSYYPYIDFNLYYSTIDNPQIRLIGEFVYFDDAERGKFAESKLEYIIETFDQDIYNFKNQKSYDGEFSFTKPCKELLWYIQPQIFKDGLTKYGQNTSLLFDYSKYYISNLVESQNITLNQLEILLNVVDDNYYNYLLSYKFLNNILPTGVYYHSFCLYPEDSQPSGCVNLREIKGKQFKIQLKSEFADVYFATKNNYLNPSNKGLILKYFSKNYDLFIVHKGVAKLMFNR